MLRGWGRATLVSCSPGSFTPVVASTLPLRFAFPREHTHFHICLQMLWRRMKYSAFKDLYCLFYILKTGKVWQSGVTAQWFRPVWIGVALSSPLIRFLYAHLSSHLPC